MLIGHLPNTSDPDLPIDELACALEDRGYESMWLGEHTHVPVGSLQPRQYASVEERERSVEPLPPAYYTTPDPIVALTFAAKATTRLRLATGVALVLQSNLFRMAKSLATLDLVSGGRAIFGVGVGWNRPEFENSTAVPWAERYAALQEFAEAMRVLWTADESSFQGKYFSFDPVWCFPKPVQQPHPPLVVPGIGPHGMRHAATWADEWFPLAYQIEDLSGTVTRFRQLVDEFGRADVPITLGVSNRGGTWPSEKDAARFQELGIKRLVLMDNLADLPTPGERMRFLDRYASWVEKFA